MTKTRFIGDVHGLKYELGLVLGNIPDDVMSVIQVGDMGVGFGQGDYWHESLEDMMQAVNGRFIRGNHDNPAQCKEMRTWIQDGRIENDVMFIGGAWSIDYQWRTMGVDLWEDEELSMHQFYGLISTYDYVRPRVMVTHDCPLSVSEELFIKRGKSFSGGQYRTRTGTALEEMFSIHKPKLWIFGHWHNNVDEVIDGTRFICLNELSYADIDLETLEVDFPELQPKRGKP
jgi:predicted phosphodiesterase